MSADVQIHDRGLNNLIIEIRRLCKKELSLAQVGTLVENSMDYVRNLKSNHPFEKQYIMRRLKPIRSYEQLVDFNNLFVRQCQKVLPTKKNKGTNTLRAINSKLSILDLFGQRLTPQVVRVIELFRAHMELQFAHSYCSEARKYLQNLQRDFYLQTSKTIQSPQQVQQVCDVLLQVCDDKALLTFFFEKFAQNQDFYKAHAPGHNIYEKLHRNQLRDLRSKELEAGGPASQPERDKGRVTYSFEDQQNMDQIDRVVHNRIFLFGEREQAIQVIRGLSGINNFAKQQTFIRRFMAQNPNLTYLCQLLAILVRKVLYVNYFINYYQFLCDFRPRKHVERLQKFDIVQSRVNQQNKMVQEMAKTQRQMFFEHVESGLRESSDIIPNSKPPQMEGEYRESDQFKQITSQLSDVIDQLQGQAGWRVKLDRGRQQAMDLLSMQTMRASELSTLPDKLRSKFDEEAPAAGPRWPATARPVCEAGGAALSLVAPSGSPGAAPPGATRPAVVLHVSCADAAQNEHLRWPAPETALTGPPEEKGGPAPDPGPNAIAIAAPEERPGQSDEMRQFAKMRAELGELWARKVGVTRERYRVVKERYAAQLTAQIRQFRELNAQRVHYLVESYRRLLRRAQNHKTVSQYNGRRLDEYKYQVCLNKLTQLRQRHEGVRRRCQLYIAIVCERKHTAVLGDHRLRVLALQQQVIEIQEKTTQLGVLGYQRLIWHSIRQKLQRVANLKDRKLANIRVFIDKQYYISSLHERYEQFLQQFRQREEARLSGLRRRVGMIRRLQDLRKRQANFAEILYLQIKSLQQKVEVLRMLR